MKAKAGRAVTIVGGLTMGVLAVAVGTSVLRIPSGARPMGPGVSGFLGAAGSTGGFVSSPVPVSDCATTDFSVLDGGEGNDGPLAGEVNTYYDPETRLDRLTGSANGTEVTFYVSVDDAACWKIPQVAGRIADDVASAAEVLEVDCADALSHLAGAPLHETEVASGMKFDPGAAQRFVDEECGGTSQSSAPASSP